MFLDFLLTYVSIADNNRIVTTVEYIHSA